VQKALCWAVPICKATDGAVWDRARTDEQPQPLDGGDEANAAEVGGEVVDGCDRVCQVTAAKSCAKSNLRSQFIS
jgi:hypothetical protein